MDDCLYARRWNPTVVMQSKFVPANFELMQMSSLKVVVLYCLMLSRLMVLRSER
jgi:hypothetical protein